MQHLPFTDEGNDDHSRGYLSNFEGFNKGKANHYLKIEGNDHVVDVQ